MDPKDIKTVDDLRKAYPALVDQIEQAAAEAAINAERKRIQSIEDMALPGSEALAAEAKFTKPMSAENFAKERVPGRPPGCGQETVKGGKGNEHGFRRQDLPA